MKFEQMLEAAKENVQRVAVAAAQDEDVLEAVFAAKAAGIAEPVLVGDEKRIRALLKEMDIDLGRTEIVAETDDAKAAAAATRLVREGKADFLMKGFLQTSTLLKAVIDKECGLRGGSLISHVAAVASSHYDRLLFFTDVAMNMYPTLKQKTAIINNAVIAAQAVGVEEPKVGILAAVEVVNEDMPATVDAAILTQMNRRGQIKGCIVDGPLAFDNALDLESAEHKGLGGTPVAGQADIFLAPNIEAGNMIYKAATKLAFCETAGILVGAKVPIVLTSRSDTAKSKLCSIAFASMVAQYQGN